MQNTKKALSMLILMLGTVMNLTAMFTPSCCNPTINHILFFCPCPCDASSHFACSCPCPCDIKVVFLELGNKVPSSSSYFDISNSICYPCCVCYIGMK